jgi:hypothetical protein
VAPAVPLLVLVPNTARPKDLFAAAPIRTSPLASPRRRSSTDGEFPTAHEPRKQEQPNEEPNVWIPRKILRDRTNHPMAEAQGKTRRRSLMQPQPLAAKHPFYPTLSQWGSRGVPIDCGPDWAWDAIEAAVARGPHRSALQPENVALVHEDIQYQVDAGFSKIVMWEDIKRHRPRQLKVSPMAVVPQKDRRGRIILDLSFPVYRGVSRRGGNDPPIQASVNDTTERLAPDHPVREIGNAFRLVLHLIDSAEADEVVMLSKIDLSDGFWRMIVEDDAEWNFAYVMPDPPGHPIRLVVPAALQMGWAESPAYFCAAMETGRDVIAKLIADRTELPPHPFEEHMHPSTPAKRSRRDRPVHGMYVYVDDYIGACVESKDGSLLGRISCAALHGIHSIFPPPEVTGHTDGKDPISWKKLLRGDGQWHPRKEILGFLVDGEAKTVRISDEKAAAIVAEIRKILKKKNVQLKRYRRIVGKLRHVALIMPGTKGLFSPINRALKGEPPMIDLGRLSEVRAALLNLAVMVTALATRPTHIQELVPGDDHYVGYCDACATGAGGVWMSGELHIAPIVWRVAFGPDIATQVVSDTNPRGRLTNSDLELAAVLLHYMVLQQEVDMRFKRAGALSDNTPTVAWTKRLADKSQSHTAGRLLRGLAATLREAQAGPLTVASVAGRNNKMADVASRSFNTPNLVNDALFLTHFISLFPLPQSQSWKLVHLMPEKISLVTSTLAGQRLPLQRWMTSSKPRTGTHGWSSARMPAKTRTSLAAVNPSNSSSLWVSLQGCGAVTTDEVVKSTLRPQKPPSVTYHKPSCWLDIPTLGAPSAPKTSTSLSHAS